MIIDGKCVKPKSTNEKFYYYICTLLYTCGCNLMQLFMILPPIILGGGWTEWIRRGFVFLVVSCPCALIIILNPADFLHGIGATSKRGVLVKGSNYLEALNNVSVIVFDKTEHLQKVFSMPDILPANGFSKEQVLSMRQRQFSRSILLQNPFLLLMKKKLISQ